MTQICFVRHGQTEWNQKDFIQGREDIPLNDTGIKQAKQSAAFLKNEHWDLVISSPLIRAYETAKIISKELGICQIELDDRFIERNFGEISGKDVKYLREATDLSIYKELEQEEQIMERVFDAVLDVAKRHEGKKMIIVAHSHTIKAFLHKIAPKEVHFGTKLNNACANYVKMQDGHWELVRFNVADHIIDN